MSICFSSDRDLPEIAVGSVRSNTNGEKVIQTSSSSRIDDAEGSEVGENGAVAVASPSNESPVLVLPAVGLGVGRGYNGEAEAVGILTPSLDRFGLFVGEAVGLWLGIRVGTGAEVIKIESGTVGGLVGRLVGLRVGRGVGGTSFVS